MISIHKMRARLFIFSVMLLLNSCAAVGVDDSDYGISYQDVESIRLGVKSNILIERFGRPDRIERYEGNDPNEGWVYFVKGHKWTRAVFWTRTLDEIISGKVFHFMDEDISKEKTFLAKFPNTKFECQRGKQVGHAISWQFFCSNEKNGVHYVLNEGRRVVESVRWVNPTAPQTLKTATVE